MLPPSEKLRKYLCPHSFQTRQSTQSSPAQLYMSKPCKALKSSSAASWRDSFLTTSNPLDIISQHKQPGLKPFRRAARCCSPAQIHLVCAAVWGSAGAAEAECFAVTDVNADFLDDSSCFVTFSRAPPKKTMHLHSCDKAGASWMGMELVLICWYLGGNRALWNPSGLSEERRHFPPLLSILFSISIAYWNDRVSKRLES